MKNHLFVCLCTLFALSLKSVAAAAPETMISYESVASKTAKSEAFVERYVLQLEWLFSGKYKYRPVGSRYRDLQGLSKSRIQRPIRCVISYAPHIGGEIDLVVNMGANNRAPVIVMYVPALMRRFDAIEREARRGEVPFNVYAEWGPPPPGTEPFAERFTSFQIDQAFVNWLVASYMKQMELAWFIVEDGTRLGKVDIWPMIAGNLCQYTLWPMVRDWAPLPAFELRAYDAWATAEGKLQSPWQEFVAKASW